MVLFIIWLKKNSWKWKFSLNLVKFDQVFAWLSFTCKFENFLLENFFVWKSFGKKNRFITNLLWKFMDGCVRNSAPGRFNRVSIAFQESLKKSFRRVWKKSFNSVRVCLFWFWFALLPPVLTIIYVFKTCV